MPLARQWNRLLRHHFPLLASASLLVWLSYGLMSLEDSRQRLSLATGYAGLVLLAGAVMIGPLNEIRCGPNPVSSDFRRDLGIWAGLLALAHVVAGLQVHLRGRMWLYFVPEEWSVVPVRMDLFGAANYAGGIATIVLLLLLAISNDATLRVLGTARWKRLQRSTYLLMLLVVVHALAYQVVENRYGVYSGSIAAVASLVILLQILGFRSARTRGGRR